jgi:DNA repair/transcription protein MET18/MMS19
MSASPYFAKLALPLFLEKFTTAAGPSMTDLMLSMAACFPTYGAAAVNERGKELWEGIKTEVSFLGTKRPKADMKILYSSDGAIEAAALKACESLARTLYPNPDDKATGLAQDMIKESLEALAEPEKAQSLGATKVLVALIRSSRE